MFCNKCGTKLLEGSNFCHHCGNNLKEVKVIIREAEESKLNQLKLDDFIKHAKPEPKDYQRDIPKFEPAKKEEIPEIVLVPKEVKPKITDQLKGYFSSLKAPKEELKEPNLEVKPKKRIEAPVFRKLQPEEKEEIRESIAKAEKKESIKNKLNTYFESIRIKDEDLKEPTPGDHEFSSKLTAPIPKVVPPVAKEVLPILEDKEKREFKFDFKGLPKKEKPEVSAVATTEVVIESDEAKLSYLQRFINFMKEDELEDGLILSKFDKKKEEPSDIEEISIEETPIEEHQAEIPEETEVIKKPGLFKNLFKRSETKDLTVELTSEEALEEAEPIVENIDTVMAETLEEATLESMTEPVEEEEFKDILTIEEEAEPETIEPKTVKDSPFKKLWAFINAEDEDNLLENIDEIEAEKEHEDIPEIPNLDTVPSTIAKITLIDKFKSFFGIGLDESELDDLEDYDEVEKKNEVTKKVVDSERSMKEPKHVYTNKDHTITYSKQVIESALKEAEEKKQRDLNETQVFNEPLVTDEMLAEATAKADEDMKIAEPVTQETKKLDFSFEEVTEPSIDDVTDVEVEPKGSPFAKIGASLSALFAGVIEFFKSIPKFFTPNEKSPEQEAAKKQDNIDIIMNSTTQSSDTIPLILSEEEKRILNDELDKRQGGPEGNILTRINRMIHPKIKTLINLGAWVRIPLLVLTFTLTYLTITWVVKHDVFRILLSVIKFIAIYVTLGTATRASLDSLGVKLKKKAVSFFIILQMLIYQVIDALILRGSLGTEQNVQSILNVFSPNLYTIGIIVFLALVMLIISYNKISERNGTLLFLGWYVVIATTITIMIILMDLLFITVISSIFLNLMF